MVIKKIYFLRLIVESSLFDRGQLVLIIDKVLFKAPIDAFVINISLNNRRTLKKRDYINGAVAKLKLALASLNLFQEALGGSGEWGWNMALVEGF